jgi:DNA-binding GntR family transcriptional regulator
MAQTRGKLAAQPTTAAFHIQKQARTLGANVATSLREEIVSGRLEPGQALGQEFLASLFGVSRVPVREALRLLAGEGLVVIEPHKGASVAKLSVEELDEMYGIVWSLERLATSVGVPRLTDEQVAAMEDLMAQLRVLKNPARWYQVSSEMHRIIVAASGWERCLRMIDECRQNIGRYLTEKQFFAEHVGEWLQRNEALFKACKARNVKAALDALDVMRQLSTAQIREHVEAVAAPAKRRAARA